METERILAEIESADMILAGLGEEFDDLSRLRNCPEFVRGKELLQESGYQWLVPAWQEYCSAKLEDIISPALNKFANILANKNYFIVATATDGRIGKTPWKKDRLVMPCGTTAGKQCPNGCGHMIEEMTEEERACINAAFGELSAGRFPSDGIQKFSKCSRCGVPMVLNTVYAENYDEQGYMKQWEVYTKWLQGTLNRKLLVLELGEGMRFPTVIRWPFEKIAYFNKKAVFVRVNEELYQLTEELSEKGLGISKNAIAWLESL